MGKIENGTIKAIMLFFGLAAILMGLGIATDKFDFASYLPASIGFGIAIALFFELGAKKMIKSFGSSSFGLPQYITIFVMLAVTMVAIMSLPFIAVSIPVISEFAGVLYVIGGVFLMLEGFVFDSS